MLARVVRLLGRRGRLARRDFGPGRRDGLGVRRWRPGHLAAVTDRRLAHDLVVEVDRPLLGPAHVGEQVDQVVGEELAGVGRQPAGHVGVAEDGHAVGVDRLAGHRALAVAALLRRQVDDDRAGAHGADHRVGDQHRCLAPGDQRRGDDDVDLGRLLGEEPVLAGQEFVGDHLGVAAAALAFVQGQVELQEAGPQAAALVRRREPHVEGADLGAQAPGGRDGRQARHARADDQHLGRRRAPGGGHLTAEEPAVVPGGLEHRSVAGDVRHGREHVHLLGPADARDLVHRDDGGATLRRPLQDLLVLGRHEQAAQDLALAQALDLVTAVSGLAGRIHLEHDVALVPDRVAARDQARPGRGVHGVRERRGLTRTTLDRDPEPQLRQPLDGVRRGRHAALPLPDLPRHSDPHPLTSWSGCAVSGPGVPRRRVSPRARRAAAVVPGLREPAAPPPRSRPGPARARRPAARPARAPSEGPPGAPPRPARRPCGRG